MSTAVSRSPRIALSSPAVLWIAWISSRIIALAMAFEGTVAHPELEYYFDAATGSVSASEYPIYLLAVPWLLVTFGALDMASFEVAFVGAALAADAALAVYLINGPQILKPLVRRDGARLAGAGFWIAFGALAGPNIYYRLDIFPAVAVSFALAFFAVNSRASSALLGLATSLKLWPGLLAAGMMGRLAHPHTRRMIGWFAGVLGGLGLVALAITGPERTWKPLSYQSGRGLQVESVLATPFVIRGFFEPGLYKVGYAASKSYEITGPGVDTALVISTLTMGFVVAFALVWAVRCMRAGRPTATELGRFFVAIILLLLATDKVYSPQYVVWFGPVVAVSLAALWEPHTTTSHPSLQHISTGTKLMSLLLLVVTGLTTYVYPFNYNPIAFELGTQWVPVAALAARNMLTVVCAGLAVVNLLHGRRRASATHAVGEHERALSTSLTTTFPPVSPLTAGVRWKAAAAIAAAGSALRLVVLAVMNHAQNKSLTDALAQWDADFYLKIAEAGYFNADIDVSDAVHFHTMAFFPGFPHLIRAVHFLTRIPLELAALIVNMGFLIALSGAVMAICQRMGLNWFATLTSCFVINCAPLSIVFNMPYTETAFMALSLWALVAMLDRRWLIAGILVFFTGFVRLTAVDLIATFALTVALRDRKNLGAWALVVFSCTPIVAYLTWANRHLAEMGGYFGIQQEYWNSRFDWGTSSVRWIVDTLTDQTGVGFFFAAVCMITVPALLIYSWGKLPLPVWLFAFTVAANVLLSGGIMNSRPRLLLPTVVLLIPVVVACARKLGTRHTIIAAMGWVLFSTWYSSFMITAFEYAI